MHIMQLSTAHLTTNCLLMMDYLNRQCLFCHSVYMMCIGQKTLEFLVFCTQYGFAIFVIVPYFLLLLLGHVRRLL